MEVERFMDEDSSSVKEPSSAGEKSIMQENSISIMKFMDDASPRAPSKQQREHGKKNECAYLESEE